MKELSDRDPQVCSLRNLAGCGELPGSGTDLADSGTEAAEALPCPASLTVDLLCCAESGLSTARSGWCMSDAEAAAC